MTELLIWLAASLLLLAAFASIANYIERSRKPKLPKWLTPDDRAYFANSEIRPIERRNRRG